MMLHFGAPTICGIKPANLFRVKKECFSDEAFLKWRRHLQKNKISAFCALQKKNALVFLYNSDWLKKILGDAFVQDYLAQKGYPRNSRGDRALAVVCAKNGLSGDTP